MKFKSFDTGNGNTSYGFHCPGCDDLHVIRYAGVEPLWLVSNAELDKPTVSPSIRVVHHKPEQQVCHSFIHDGVIEFLSDSTHVMAGEKHELPDVEQTESIKFLR